MSLPLLNVPYYSLKLPISNKKIQYRPFLVKEEKILLLAKETEQESDIIDAICQIISNCTNGEVNAREIPIADMEYLFLNIRGRSVGEVCRPVVQLEDENGKLHEKTLEIPINTIEVVKDPTHSLEIRIDENVVVKMRYPSFDVSENAIKSNANEIDSIFSLTRMCIDEIFVGEKSWKSKDLSEKDINAFIDSMTQDQFSNFISFFEKLPKLKKTMKVMVGKKEHEITLEGISDFFS